MTSMKLAFFSMSILLIICVQYTYILLNIKYRFISSANLPYFFTKITEQRDIGENYCVLSSDKPKPVYANEKDNRLLVNNLLALPNFNWFLD